MKCEWCGKEYEIVKRKGPALTKGMCSRACTKLKQQNTPEYKEYKRSYDKTYRLRNRKIKDDRTNAYRRSGRGLHKTRLATLKKFNLTEDEYRDFQDNQKGMCAICGISLVTPDRINPCIDHNHKTEEVRGLLCQKCNSGLGNFNDSPSQLIKAYEYLLSRGYYGEK